MIQLMSFGYRHAAPPDALITVDLRDLLRDPQVDPDLKPLTGLHPQVMAAVIRTPGARDLVRQQVTLLARLHHETTGPVTFAAGCAGGRHRSVALVRRIQRGLHDRHIRPADITVEHRDIDRPVLPPRGDRPLCERCGQPITTDRLDTADRSPGSIHPGCADPPSI